MCGQTTDGTYINFRFAKTGGWLNESRFWREWDFWEPTKLMYNREA
jgi:hypothetical protein